MKLTVKKWLFHKLWFIKNICILTKKKKISANICIFASVANLITVKLNTTMSLSFVTFFRCLEQGNEKNIDPTPPEHKTKMRILWSIYNLFFHAIIAL